MAQFYRITDVKDFIPSVRGIFPKTKDKVKVNISALAWGRMQSLVKGSSLEIAWHGIVDRTEDGAFFIEDITVPPQIVTSANVDVDDVRYSVWLAEHPEFDRIRMQGHSHVNMGVSPSGVDLDYYDTVASQLGADDFYIFMILNKRGDMTCIVLDGDIVYENSDVNVVVDGDFYAEASKMVQRPKPKVEIKKKQEDFVYDIDDSLGYSAYYGGARWY